MGELIRSLKQVPINTPHPECGSDETFICYEEREKTNEMKLPGKRLGLRAFLGEQEVTDMARAHGIVPVFANREEHAKRYG